MTFPSRLRGREFRGGGRKPPPELPKKAVAEVTAYERAGAPFLYGLSGHDAARVAAAKQWAAREEYAWLS